MHLAANLFDNWIFLLLVAVAALLRWLASKATSSRRQSNSEEPATPRAEEPEREAPSSDEEQIRKFLEALGQPRTAKPPPPLPARTDIPPRPVAPVTPPRSLKPVFTSRTAKSSTEPKTFEPRRQEQTAEAPPPKFIYEPSPQPVISPESTVFEVRETTVPLVQKQSTRKAAARISTEPGADLESQPVDLMQLLRSPTGLRQAIILREIFGVPRGLQRFEDLPGTA